MDKNHFFHHLSQEVKKHLFQYLVLLAGAFFFLFLLIFLKENRFGRFLVITFFVLFYLIWGIIHHFLEKTLHLKIVVEYILIGATALFLLKVLLIP